MNKQIEKEAILASIKNGQETRISNYEKAKKLDEIRMDYYNQFIDKISILGIGLFSTITGFATIFYDKPAFNFINKVLLLLFSIFVLVSILAGVVNKYFSTKALESLSQVIFTEGYIKENNVFISALKSGVSINLFDNSNGNKLDNEENLNQKMNTKVKQEKYLDHWSEKNIKFEKYQSLSMGVTLISFGIGIFVLFLFLFSILFFT